MFWSVSGGGGFILVAVTVVALFTVPRPEFPDAVPYPPVDVDRTSREMDAARQAVRAAIDSPLAVDVRGVGERVRRCGRLEVLGPPVDLTFELGKLREGVLLLLQQERGEDLVRLRELEAALLHRALVDFWSSGGGAAPDGDLVELGARLSAHLEPHRSWLPSDPYFEPTLRALFAERWSALTGTGKHPILSPSANDWRLIHRFRALRLLRDGTPGDGAELRSVLADVAKYSPGYPYDYAAGVVFYRMGAFEEAMGAFGRHLTAFPTSDWAIRAQNFRLEAARALVQ